MNVHRILGCGFQEVVYQRAMEIELPEWQIKFQREFKMPIFFKGHRIAGRRVEFFVEEKLSVELKALLEITPLNISQAKNYLEAYNLEVGLLINFGAMSLQFKRLQNTRFRQGTSST